MGNLEKKLAPSLPDKENLRVQVASWLMMIVLGITVCAGVGFYLRNSNGRSFLGSHTMMVGQCKRNPNSNPDECEEILAARSKRPVRRSNKNIAGAIPLANFQLSSSED
jgi:hypothetical protein